LDGVGIQGKALLQEVQVVEHGVHQEVILLQVMVLQGHQVKASQVATRIGMGITTMKHLVVAGERVARVGMG